MSGCLRLLSPGALPINASSFTHYLKLPSFPMTNVPQPFPIGHKLTRPDARKFAEELWHGRLAKTTRVGRLAGLLLVGISLLVRFFVEVPREASLPLNNLVFFAGAALLLFASVAIPVTTQCLLLSHRRAGVAKTRLRR
jgi:hypothetical protein